MSRSIRKRVETSKRWRRLRIPDMFVWMGLTAVVLVVPLGGLMAGVDEPTGQIDVYFLSPRILTRIAMTPERLETDKLRVDRKVSSMPALMNLLKGVRSKSHQPTGRSRFAYDFRLCVRADGRSTCFSGDGTVGYVSTEPFLLSVDERDGVQDLLKVLDGRISHDSDHTDPPKPR